MISKDHVTFDWEELHRPAICHLTFYFFLSSFAKSFCEKTWEHYYSNRVNSSLLIMAPSQRRSLAEQIADLDDPTPKGVVFLYTTSLSTGFNEH